MKIGRDEIVIIILAAVIIISVILSIPEKSNQDSTDITPLIDNSSLEITEECKEAKISIQDISCGSTLKINIKNEGSLELGTTYPVKINYINLDGNNATTYSVMKTSSSIKIDETKEARTKPIKGTIYKLKLISGICFNALEELEIELKC